MSLAELRKLLVKRSHLEGKLKSIGAFAQHFDSSKHDINDIQVRLADMPKIRDDYEAVIFEIVSLEIADESMSEEKGDRNPTESKGENEMLALDKFDTDWLKIMSDLQRFFQRLSVAPSADVPLASSVQAHSQFNVRLPRINLPQFSGEYTDWLPFYNAFDSLIHNNSTLDDCQKFHYLKSCLMGEAARPIESLAITANNYQSAWSILQKRYKNDRLIVQSHVSSILNTPELSKPSAEGLRKLVNDISANLEALKVMQIQVDSWDAFLVPLIISRIDYQSGKELELILDSGIPKLKDILEFLEKRCVTLKCIQGNSKTSKPEPTQIKKDYTKRSSHVVTTRLACRYCDKRHFVNQCGEFLRLSIGDRIKEVKNKNLCLNCLRKNHTTSACKAKGCSVCGARTHHSLLHDRSAKNSTEPDSPNHCFTNKSQQETKVNATVNHVKPKGETHVILSTALIWVKDCGGQYQECRALLDVGSQINLMSTATCKRLGLKPINTTISLSGINHTCTKISKSAEIWIKSSDSRFKMPVTCCITERVTANLPIVSFNPENLSVPSNINLADPDFNTSRPVDLLLGAEIFWELLCNDRRKLSSPSLFLTKTLLGWVVGGASYNLGNSERPENRVANLAIKDKSDELQQLMEKFWLQEEIPETKEKWSKEEIECEEQFKRTYMRDPSDGRFIVKLPFKNGNVQLGDSSGVALRRFLSLERRFKKDPKLKQLYSNAMQELIHSNIVERVPEGEATHDSTFYLPHSGIVKETGQKVKIRIVYDGSAKSTNGLSLNDNLMTGPNLQTELFSLLIRFRTHQIAFSCDMEKMFLQVKIDPEDMNYQRFFWRNSESEPVQIYRLTRLVFGLTNSPFTAMRCVRQLATDSAETFLVASETLERDIYMDDVLSGASTIQGALKARDELIEVLNGGGFKLSKWASNDSRLIPTPLEKGNEDRNTIELDKADTSKVLGLIWNCKEDTLHFKVSVPTSHCKITKRTILSSIAKLFDPIGIVSPVIVKAKLIMKELWACKLKWDDEIPLEIQGVWRKYLEELDELSSLVISRKVLPISGGVHDLIMFCDASLQAYGASIYIRTRLNDGSYNSYMVCSKSKVSPVKVITLPRLELCAAVLGAKLINRVSQALKLKFRNKYYFSDSEIVLHYIKSNANTWQVFVGNRVSQIQKLSDIRNWYHVDSKNNPADIVSRGAFPRQLMHSELYWKGPKFLTHEESEWPKSKLNKKLDANDLPEKRKVVLVTARRMNLIDFSMYSSISKMQSIVAYVLRFSHNLKNKNSKRVGSLTTEELNEARSLILKQTQAEEFQQEIAALSKNNPVSKSSKIINLDPFLDKRGLLRVGGRLHNASIKYERKYPILLPEKHHVTTLLIRSEHISLMHAGPTQTLASIRRKYWPIGARNSVKKVINSCIICFRTSPKLIQQKMGNLPKVRTELVRPFLHVGVDYFGPLHLKYGKRSKIREKAWVALFVCMASKAVHLEVVANMTSESFINALKRMIARRGKVSEIYCDNAKTFVGAKADLESVMSNLLNDQLQAYLVLENIKWNFIPPRSPNFGGLWERLVRSAKQHFKKIALNHCLTFEEAVTLITQIEAIINSRPLTPLSQDPSDLHCLTPAHFLIGESLTDILEEDLEEVKANRLTRWQLVQQMKQYFWKRWSREVLHQMQTRPKWQSSSLAPQKGDLVLLSEDNIPPLAWKLARIEEVFPGSDGVVRVASVRTSQGTYKRSIRKLAVLPKE